MNLVLITLIIRAICRYKSYIRDVGLEDIYTRALIFYFGITLGYQITQLVLNCMVIFSTMYGFVIRCTLAWGQLSWIIVISIQSMYTFCKEMIFNSNGSDYTAVETQYAARPKSPYWKKPPKSSYLPSHHDSYHQVVPGMGPESSKKTFTRPHPSYIFRIRSQTAPTNLNLRDSKIKRVASPSAFG
jgi:hypothetical protein